MNKIQNYYLRVSSVLLLVSTGVLSTSLVYAQSAAFLTNLRALVTATGTLINVTIGVIVTASFMFFFWNLAKYLKSEGGDEKLIASRKIGWSVLVIVLMVSLWGVVGILQSTLGIGTGTTPQDIDIPGFQTNIL